MIWATGDCHGNFERFRPEYFPEQAQMTKDDVVVVTGDFGGIWFGDARDDEALGCLESLPFTLAFVDGNHENYDALASYPAEKWQGGKIHRIRPHVLHLMRGQIYELEGYRFFTMGGAKSHDIEDGRSKLWAEVPDAAAETESQIPHQPYFMVGAGAALRRRIRRSTAQP